LTISKNESKVGKHSKKLMGTPGRVFERGTDPYPSGDLGGILLFRLDLVVLNSNGSLEMPNG
jgi:hypothetical protein